MEVANTLTTTMLPVLPYTYNGSNMPTFPNRAEWPANVSMLDTAIKVTITLATILGDLYPHMGTEPVTNCCLGRDGQECMQKYL